MSAIRNFTNPFTLVDKDHLYCLSSGAPASPEVEADVLRAEAAGKEAKDKFIQIRMKNSREVFFEPINKLRLKTMEASNKTIKLTASQGRVNTCIHIIMDHQTYTIMYTFIIRNLRYIYICR